jgi:hypothetical protein
MPYLRMQRLGICGPAVRQRPRHLPRYETALPQDVLLASVVHKRIVPYHAAEDIAPWVWSGYPPPHERGRSPMTQNPSHPALGSRCFSGSHAHRKPLAQTPSFVSAWELENTALMLLSSTLEFSALLGSLNVSERAGCEFSGVQTRRTLAMVEDKRGRRGRCSQKIAWHAVAASTTKWA